MSKLFVDDIRNAPDESWMVARTISSAINALSMMDFESVSLDHDISHQVTIGEVSRPYPCDETFVPVAHYLGLSHSCTGKIVLHTSNPIGAQNMQKILMHHGYEEKDIEIRPFGMANRLEMEI